MSRSYKERFMLFACIYLVYSVFLTSESFGFGRSFMSRLLSNIAGGDGQVEDLTDKLEFVHITESGGGIVEKAAASVGVNWGACHFISLKDSIGCAEPDYEWSAPETGNFLMTSRWHTPPKDLLKGGMDKKENNPYIEKDLFTVVRNPYTRVLAEYHNKWSGCDDDECGNSERMNSWIMRKLSDLTMQRADYRARLENGEDATDIGCPTPLDGKHLTPQVDYVYNDEGQRLIKNVIHHEDLKSEFKALMKEHGLGKIMKIPSSTGQEKKELSFLNLQPETISMVNQFYLSDFQAFGYEMVEDFASDQHYSIRATATPCTEIGSDNVKECERDTKQSETSDGDDTNNDVIPIGLPHATTFLLGIFSDLSEQDALARERIRDTYLKESDELRVCSLNQYINQHQSSRGLWVPCRIPYVFIVAGDPQRPDEHLDDYPVSIDRSLVTNAPEEDDIIYLNISENDSHAGKARAYFKWAASIGEVFHIDFIGKAASSTLLDTTKLLHFLDMELPPAPLNRRMYGGETWGSKTTYFATKPFYFMSIDLANYVGQRKVGWEWVEAVDISRIIFSHPKPIKYVNCNPKLFWYDGLDTHQKWYDKWMNDMSNLPRSKSFIDTMGVCNELKENSQL
uniref:Sulfotransferase domain-containing protein n=1 Tax=Chaetoceros debilis TaxID=122233 RepID=A0A7S3QJJ5_9STRA|mmetsp:Transcript_29574/g.45152  ORF Transcript_29574/g.45152 Transcript_29574/m.45152 type:complete len:625 (-) Transcript_29574:12-1886(-)